MLQEGHMLILSVLDEGSSKLRCSSMRRMYL